MAEGIMNTKSLDSAKLQSQQKSQGTYWILEDTNELYYDVTNDIRIKIRDIIILQNEMDRLLATSSAVQNSFYFVTSTKKLWVYGNNWVEVNKDVGTTGTLFLARQGDNTVLTHKMPTGNQQVTDRQWINANWGEWTEIASFVAADDVADKEVEFVPGNRFFAKLWLSSDIERTNAQLRLDAVDVNDGTLLASATTTVNLLNISSILTPATFENKYLELRVLPLSQVRTTLSVMVLEQGVQVSLVSNSPNEISYIAPMSTSSDAVAGGGYATREEIKTPNIFYSSTKFEDFMRGFTNPISRNVFEPVYYDGPIHGNGASAFYGGVLALNGKVVFVPQNSATIGVYDPITNTYFNGPVHGQGPGAFSGGVLAPNGKIIFVPRSSTTVGIYDPMTNTYSNGPAHGKSSGDFIGGVLSPNGKIIFVPYDSTTVGIYDPITNTYSNGPAHGRGSAAFLSGVLAPNGKIIFAPQSSTTVGIYDPITNTYSNGPTHGRGSFSFIGGVLAPNGKIIFVPRSSTTVGIYDPMTNTYSNGPAHGGISTAFYGGVLAPNGKIIFVPRSSTTVGIYDPITDIYSDGPAHGKDSNAFNGGILSPNGKIIFVPLSSPNIGVLDLSGNDMGTGYCLHPYLNKY